jgi:hypothetical protein
MGGDAARPRGRALRNEESRAASGESDEDGDRGFSGGIEHDISSAFEAGGAPISSKISFSGSLAVREITLRRARVSHRTHGNNRFDRTALHLLETRSKRSGYFRGNPHRVDRSLVRRAGFTG